MHATGGAPARRLRYGCDSRPGCHASRDRFPRRSAVQCFGRQLGERKLVARGEAREMPEPVVHCYARNGRLSRVAPFQPIAGSHQMPQAIAPGRADPAFAMDGPCVCRAPAAGVRYREPSVSWRRAIGDVRLCSLRHIRCRRRRDHAAATALGRRAKTRKGDGCRSGIARTCFIAIARSG